MWGDDLNGRSVDNSVGIDTENLPERHSPSIPNADMCGQYGMGSGWNFGHGPCSHYLAGVENKYFDTSLLRIAHLGVVTR